MLSVKRTQTSGRMSKGVAAPPKGTAVVVDGDYAKIERLPEAVKDKAGKPIVPPTSAVDAGAGAPAVMPDVPKDSVSLQFLDDDTVVLARRGGEAVEKDAMAAVLKLDAASSVVGSQGFMEMIDGIDTSAPIWFVINGKTPGGAKMTGNVTIVETFSPHMLVQSDERLHEITLRALSQLRKGN